MNPFYSVAFYNLENLFDPEDGNHTRDRDYTPDGRYRWDERRYRQKIENLGLAISKIGSERAQSPPLLLGVCEVENERCLSDLVQSRELRDHGYGFVHYESLDRRGLDTAFMYQKKHFRLIGSKPFSAPFQGSGDKPTRDILHVEGELFSERLNIIVNHWPSRVEGSRKTRNKRREMALLLEKIVNSIYSRDPGSKILILGDFNDQPNDQSLRQLLSHDFVNALLPGENPIGTVRFRKKWILFDQILLNKNLLKAKNLIYKESRVYHPPFLIQSQGRHKGSPRRSYQGTSYQGGYSDHLPVYALFESPH